MGYSEYQTHIVTVTRNEDEKLTRMAVIKKMTVAEVIADVLKQQLLDYEKKVIAENSALGREVLAE